MDIHKPRAAHSWREFVVEIGTITLGILIALALESLVEAARNRETVATARAPIVAELKANRAHLAEVVQAARTDEDSLKAYLAYGQARLRHQPAVFPKDAPLLGNFTTLSSSAWEAAVAAQVFVHMPYEQTSAVTRAYAASRAFNAMEDKAEAQWFGLAAIGDDPEHLSEAEMRKAIADLRIAAVHQTAVEQAGARILTEYDQAITALQR